MLDGPELLRILWRRAWFVVPLIVIGAVIGALYSHSQKLTYTSQQSIVLSGEVSNPLVVSETNLSQNPSQLVQTQVDILESPTLLDEVKKQVGVSDVALSVTSSTTSNLITVNATTSSRTLAMQAIGQIVHDYMSLINSGQNKQLAVAQRVLRGQLAQVRLALKKSSGAETQALTQQTASLETTLDEVLAAKALGSSQAQRVGQPRSDAGMRSPSIPQGALIGAVIGLILAALIAVTVRRPTFEDGSPIPAARDGS